MTFLPPRARANSFPDVSFSIAGTVLNSVASFKYLGMFVQCHWGFCDHLARMSGRAGAAVAELKRILERLEVRDP
jgi:hypothetical protein